MIAPEEASQFHCPLLDKEVVWESAHTFNPAAVVRNGKVYLIYRAEDESGSEIEKRTSRLGLAESEDGLHFTKYGTPIFYPDRDEQMASEWPGGCEDPRIVESEEGLYVMTYSQWNRENASLAIATSEDLIHWTKRGYAFGSSFREKWSKSGSIVCRIHNDRLIAAKIQGKYWMYYGEGLIHAATSEDLISWTIVLDSLGQPLTVLQPRSGLFDGALVEPGPPAILTKDGVVLLYNGKNHVVLNNSKIPPRAYSAGQVLFDRDNPLRVVDWPQECFLYPERTYEKTGQYKKGTVFVEGLVYFHNRWLLYYGMADSYVGAAMSP